MSQQRNFFGIRPPPLHVRCQKSTKNCDRQNHNFDVMRFRHPIAFTLPAQGRRLNENQQRFGVLEDDGWGGLNLLPLLPS